jgi:nitrite reductase/ring-hydroxylating ferredoxin subunit
VTEFVKVGSLSEFTTGGIHEREAGGKRVIVVNTGDAVYAMSSVCPHAGLPLGDGWLDAGSVVCPFHGSAFELTSGEGVQGPAAGDAIDVYEVRIEGGDVLVAPDTAT